MNTPLTVHKIKVSQRISSKKPRKQDYINQAWKNGAIHFLPLETAVRCGVYLFHGKRFAVAEDGRCIQADFRR
jgi:hypothetical protein